MRCDSQKIYRDRGRAQPSISRTQIRAIRINNLWNCINEKILFLSKLNCELRDLIATDHFGNSERIDES